MDNILGLIIEASREKLDRAGYNWLVQIISGFIFLLVALIVYKVLFFFIVLGHSLDGQYPDISTWIWVIAIPTLIAIRGIILIYRGIRIKIARNQYLEQKAARLEQADYDEEAKLLERSFYDPKIKQQLLGEKENKARGGRQNFTRTDNNNSSRDSNVDSKSALEKQFKEKETRSSHYNILGLIGIAIFVLTLLLVVILAILPKEAEKPANILSELDEGKHSQRELHSINNTTRKSYDGTDNGDGDGLIDIGEFSSGTDPANDDSDEEGVPDEISNQEHKNIAQPLHAAKADGGTGLPNDRGKLALTGVISKPGDEVAIINGEYYKKGDIVDGYKIISISYNTVVLEKEGHKTKLQVK